jgi:hypothetical protein
MMAKRLTLAALVALMGLYSVGCNSSKEPFKSWGAAEKYQDYVPATAKPVAEGTGKLSFTAKQDGTLYVVDTSDMVQIKEARVPRAIGSGLVLAGRTIEFDPQTGMIGAVGREGVKLKNIDPSHRYELRFDPEKSAESK